VFEDLHWAGSGTIEFFDFLTRNLGDLPVLLVGTYRSDEIDTDRPVARALVELGRHRALARIELRGLDREATVTLMAGILGYQPEWSLVDAVHSRSEGNPFFAEELTAWRDTTTVPSALRNVIMLRVERLTPDARRVVALAATAGTVIDHRLLIEASDLDDARLHAAVADAVVHGVLAVDDRTAFRFRHSLQRDTIYDALLPIERAALHRRIATTLTLHPELGAAGPGYAAVELAAHWWEAGDWPNATRTSIAAGDAMMALLAMPEAHAHYEHALAAWERAPDPHPRDDERQRVIERTADCAYFSGASARACELARIALDRVDAARAPEHAARCYARLARYTFTVGHVEDAFRYFGTAADLLPRDPPTAELAGILALEARCLLVLSQLRDAAAKATEAIAIADAAGARAEGAHALDTLGMCRGMLGHFDEGIAAVRTALTVAEELLLPDNLNLGYTHLSLLLLHAGNLEAAAGVALDGPSVGEALGGIRLNGAVVNSAQALIDLGRFDDAEALLADLGDLVGNCTASPPLLRAEIAIRRGDWDLATELVKVVDTMTAHLADVEFRGGFLTIAAELALAEGRAADACRDIEHAIALGTGTEDPMLARICTIGVRALADDVDAARLRGKKPDVDAAVPRADALLREAERVVTGPLTTGGIPLPAPLAFLATGRAERSRLGPPDPDRWAEAASAWESLSRRFDSAYCRWREAEAVLQQGSGRSRASALLEQSWKTAVTIGADDLRNRIERLAQRARIDLAVADDDEPEAPWERVAGDLDLTAREVEVLDQLARGRTDRQIADALFISRKTVSVHVSNILRKLDVRSRVDAGDIGQRAGLGTDVT
jgi:DNA-binding CsgD family transcriptional regulator/tetratricopeptide (TPR) repeat protein